MRRGWLAVVLGLLLPLQLAAQAGAEFTEWARARLVPIDAEGRAFRSLDPALAGVRLIGMGESVHETAPFQTFRFRLLQDLVRRQRVTALVLESGIAEVRAMDDYVRGKSSSVDFDAALPGYFGGLAETRRAMEWLREWNHGEGRAHPVAVYGADLPGRAGNMVPGLDHLAQLVAEDEVSERLIASIRPVAEQVGARWWKGEADKYDSLPAETRATLAMNVSLLADRVNHLEGPDRDRLEWARRVAFVIEQSEASLRLGVLAPTVPRDHALAENVLWVLGRIGRGERAVYWAHNAHVQRVPIAGAGVPPGTFIASGRRLDLVLGKAYFAIGTTYGGPAMDDQSAPAEGSIDAALGSAGTGPFLLLLRGGDAPPQPVSAWLMQPRPMRFQAKTLTVPLGQAFDAVAYFAHAEKAERAVRQP